MLKSLAIIACLCCCGCAHITVSKTVSSTGTNVAFHGTSFLANSTLKSLGIDRATKTTSSLLNASGAATEPNAEAITASAEALGNIIGAAVAAAAKGAVKP